MAHKVLEEEHRGKREGNDELSCYSISQQGTAYTHTWTNHRPEHLVRDTGTHKRNWWRTVSLSPSLPWCLAAAYHDGIIPSLPGCSFEASNYSAATLLP